MNTGGVVVPTGGRTTAATDFGAEYIYWASGGLSWAMPYVLGLYAIAGEIDPDITKIELKEKLFSTSTRNVNGYYIINPVGFIAEILRGVGKEEEASMLLEEVQKRTEYFYAIFNTEMMTEADIKAIDLYLSNIIDAKVIKVDARDFDTAKELYIALKNDISERKGTVSGIQIFGNSDIVPSFKVNYRVEMKEAIDEGGEFLSDLFYGNFENDPEIISEGYSAYDHFSKNLEVDFIPQWPVARLPLAKGEFSTFLKKYTDFEKETKLERLDLVNFSNPIFATHNPIDDMGAFLNRAKKEFGILDTDYRLYGNLDGDYPVSTKVLGNFTAENLSIENETGMAEFIISTHGQWDNVDRCFYIDGEEKRESLMNMSNINHILDENYYYLDMWTCLNGYDMKNNITSKALNGKCVGMFSATAVISNNGVHWDASLSEMQRSNFYWFYYNYLKALDEGESRSDSFFLAQEAYAKAVFEDAKNPMRYDANYQFNVGNLLAYHNFGLIEKTSLIERSEKIIAEARPEDPNSAFAVDYTDEKYSKIIDYEDYFYTIGSKFEKGEIFCVGFERTEEGFVVCLDALFEGGAIITCFAHPKGDKYYADTISVKGERKIYVFEITCNELDEIEEIKIMLNFGAGEDATMISFDVADAE
ncbi:MAG: hypothetical protein IIU57_02440, partial [Oscillospiraceae bacterium]|nr:hypothetical protein [Oscillospiraceae bacterium]